MLRYSLVLSLVPVASLFSILSIVILSLAIGVAALAILVYDLAAAPIRRLTRRIKRWLTG